MVVNADNPGLERFIEAQRRVYAQALAELRTGRKRSHWMWFIFPQIAGLGRSPTAQFYAIRSLDRAVAYLLHPLLGHRLRECTQTLLELEGKTAAEIFGHPDDMKLRSCMTLFEAAAGHAAQEANTALFARALKKYFNDLRDDQTLRLIGSDS